MVALVVGGRVLTAGAGAGFCVEVTFFLSFLTATLTHKTFSRARRVEEEGGSSFIFCNDTWRGATVRIGAGGVCAVAD